MSAIETGAVFSVPYPFSHTTVDLPSGDPEAPYSTFKSWKPGPYWEQCEGGDFDAFADGVGAMLLTVIDVHKPGRFPARVFFTRQWRDPNGKVFGKGALRITTVPAFRRRIKGYLHEFYLDGEIYTGSTS